jgi:hypothetical protein
MQSGDQNTLGTQYDQHTLGDQDQGSSLASDETHPRAHHGRPLFVGSPFRMACSLSRLTVRFNRLGRT